MKNVQRFIKNNHMIAMINVLFYFTVLFISKYYESLSMNMSTFITLDNKDTKKNIFSRKTFKNN